jgi:hypothetical protein
MPIVLQIAGENENTSYENTPEYKAFIERLRQKDSLPVDRLKILDMYRKELRNQRDSILKSRN